MSLTKATYSMIQGEVVNVLDYGAYDNNTNPTQTTAAFAAALATGKTVFIPEGTFQINGALQIQDGQSVFGAGSGATTINCNQTGFSGIFFSMGGHTSFSGVTLNGINATDATGIKCWDSSNQYGFTGYITIRDVNIFGMRYGLYVNNIFFLDYQIGLLQNNIRGIHIVPAYSPSFDSGYVTTLTFYKVDMISNQYGVYCQPTLNSPNIMFRDCGIENNADSHQGYFEKCNPLVFENCYFENQPTVYALQLLSCDTTLNECYINNTGGINLQATSNTLRANHVYCTQVTDSIVGTGTILQDVHLYNSQFGSNSILGMSKLHMYHTYIGATYYPDFKRNLPQTITGDVPGYNPTQLSEVKAYKKTVSASIGAGATVALISDQSSPNLWVQDYTVGTASIADVYKPGLILTVTPATTGSSDYFCVLATNTTGSTITLTNAKLKVLFLSGFAIAL